MKDHRKRSFAARPGVIVLIIVVALAMVLAIATVALGAEDNNEINGKIPTQVERGFLKIAKVITGDMPEGGPWTQDDFSITVTGPGGYYWHGSFPADGPIVLSDLVPGIYTVTEDATGASWIVTGEGDVTVLPGVQGQAGVIITNEGVTTTTEEITTTESITTTSVPTTGSTAPPTTEESGTTTPTPSEIQTGGGGTAGIGSGIYALIALAAVLGVGLAWSGFRTALKRK